MSENVTSYFLTNIVPILLTLIVVLVVFYILSKLFDPFKKIKDGILKFFSKRKDKKIQDLSEKYKDLQQRHLNNKKIIDNMNKQLKELSVQFNDLVKMEAEYAENITLLEQLENEYTELANNTFSFFKKPVRFITKPFRKRKIIKQKNKIMEMIEIHEENIKNNKEIIKIKITEMLNEVTNLSN